MILFFDTETSGKVDFKADPLHPSQPHLIQLGAALYTPEAKEVASLNLLVRLEQGVRIDPEAERIHGISFEKTQLGGVSRRSALTILGELALCSKLVVAFNKNFDIGVIRAACNREGTVYGMGQAPTFCAMEGMTPVCRIPSPYRAGQYKWPKLVEAHRHCFGEEFDGAHDALADVRATARVFFWMLKNGAAKLP